MKAIITFIILLITFSVINVSCKKSDYLGILPDQSLVVPESVSDYQALLDNIQIMNGASDGLWGVNPSFAMAGSDEYYTVKPETYLSFPLAYQKLYTWQDDIYSSPFYEWSYPYRTILYANTALEGINKIATTTSEIAKVNNIQGSALFFRGEMLFNLAQVFAEPYDQNSSNNIYGLPLRLTSDVNEKVSRSTVEKTYDQIIHDLKSSIPLLPVEPLYKTRPSKRASLGLLARIYLTIGNFDSAYFYSNQCLKLNDDLMNFSSLDSNQTFPIPRFNSEVIFHSCLILNYNFMFSRLYIRVDSNIVKSYEIGDLRLKLFLANETSGKSFKGSYDQSKYLWGGLANDEILLIRAESFARMGRVEEAMADLNFLLKSRWKVDSNGISLFVDKVAISKKDALDMILLERKKELLYRGLRWSDLRRLNKEGANITIKRIVNNNQIFLLEPNSKKYTYIIPPEVISLNPNIRQIVR